MGKVKILCLIMLLVSVSIPKVFSQEDIIERFKQKNGEDWDIEVAPWGYINFIARKNPELIYEPITEDQAKVIAENFLSDNSEFFGLREVEFVDISFTENAELRGEVNYLIWTVNFEGQYFEDIPIEDTYTKVLVSVDGQVYGVGNRRFPVDELSDDISESKNNAGDTAGKLGFKNPVNTKLIINENDGNFSYAWKFIFGEPDNVEISVDENGEISTQKVEVEEKNNNIYVALVICSVALIIVLFLIFRKRN